ncbi:hypothetical protein EHQ94_18070 [Leptospira meyeri]|nr:hypothetical protein EHQ50_10960 [Leptospira meyeri]TGM24570.1 hypothetical protein EHQ73_04570 [Leptospira meyeri]TGM64850.1 hypothetical protein EHQ94_18070 [Leptospira meyeri]TGM68090.1 hypothetical protein EHQ93_03280 [Leptospira meyeri]
MRISNLRVEKNSNFIGNSGFIRRIRG